MKTPWRKVWLGEVLRLDLDRIPVDVDTTYPIMGVLSFGRGLFDREPAEREEILQSYPSVRAEHIDATLAYSTEREQAGT